MTDLSLDRKKGCSLEEILDFYLDEAHQRGSRKIIEHDEKKNMETCWQIQVSKLENKCPKCASSVNYGEICGICLVTCRCETVQVTTQAQILFQTEDKENTFVLLTRAFCPNWGSGSFRELRLWILHHDNMMSHASELEMDFLNSWPLWKKIKFQASSNNNTQLSQVKKKQVITTNSKKKVTFSSTPQLIPQDKESTSTSVSVERIIPNSWPSIDDWSQYCSMKNIFKNYSTLFEKSSFLEWMLMTKEKTGVPFASFILEEKDKGTASAVREEEDEA